jgi:hypothetical protein
MLAFEPLTQSLEVPKPIEVIVAGAPYAPRGYDRRLDSRGAVIDGEDVLIHRRRLLIRGASLISLRDRWPRLCAEVCFSPTDR